MRFLFTICLLFCCVSLFSQSEKLTNDDIMNMLSIGFSEEVILTKIATSDCEFDTSIDALKTMKEKNVSDNIIMAIMNCKSIISHDRLAENDKIGIYYIENDVLSKIYPSVFSGQKTNTLGSALSYGLASSDIKSTISNSESDCKIKDDTPEFMFYFGSNSNDDLSNWWFYAASSPREFVLVRLDVKKKKREMKVGSVNIYSGSKIEIAERHLIPFSIDETAPMVFKVYPKQPLEDGEYCFFYQGIIPQGGYTNQSVFDFSIRSGKKINKKYRERWGNEYMDDAYH